MNRSKSLGLLAVLLIGIGMLLIGVRWVHYRLTHAITEAVFVESETFTNVAYKRVSGRVEELLKKEGDYVRRGEPLAKVEDRDYRLKLEEVEREIGSLRKEIESMRVQLTASRKEILGNMEGVRSEIDSLGEEIRAIDTRVKQLEKDRERYRTLYEKGVVPSKSFEDIDTELRSMLHRRSSLEAKVGQAKSNLAVLKAKLEGLGSIEKRIQSLEEKMKALEKTREDLLNLIEETTLRSPVNGYVAKRYVSVGDVVRAGQFIYTIYDPEDLYVLVLLEETKLEGVREGNRAIVKIDAFPKEEFVGVVEEIGKATAAKFALIPRDITAGEFTKVAQRIPIKIRILEGKKELLRVGMGGEVAIEKKAP